MNERLILAAALVEQIASKVKRELVVEQTYDGAGLIGHRYLPPFSYYYDKIAVDRDRDDHYRDKCWRIVDADFVTTDSGTGIVHLAPAFGEVDYEVLVTAGASLATMACH